MGKDHLPALNRGSGSNTSINQDRNDSASDLVITPKRTSVAMARSSRSSIVNHTRKPPTSRRISIATHQEEEDEHASSPSLDFLLRASKTGTTRVRGPGPSRRLSLANKHSKSSENNMVSRPSNQDFDEEYGHGSALTTDGEARMLHGSTHGIITSSRRVSIIHNPLEDISHHTADVSAFCQQRQPPPPPAARYKRPLSNHSNLTDFQQIEEMERQRELEAKQWRAKLATQTTNNNDAVEGRESTVQENKSHAGGGKTTSKKKNILAKKRVSNDPFEFLDFSNVDQLETVNAAQEEAAGKRTIPAWKSKWENALLVNEAAARFMAKKKQLNYDLDDSKSVYGYRHKMVDPNAIYQEGQTQVKSWRYNGELIQESIARGSVARRESRMNMASQMRPSTACDVVGDLEINATANYWENAFRRRRSTVPANINLMTNILTDDTTRRIEKDLIGLASLIQCFVIRLTLIIYVQGQKRLGKCPFYSDPDLSSHKFPSLWGVLRKFHFPTEQDKKVLDTVHKLHPTAVSKYKDLRKILQWAPLKYSVFRSSIEQAKRKDETSWIPVTMDDYTNEVTFPPPKISAVGLLKQRQDMVQDINRNRMLGPIARQENDSPIPIALIPTLTNRIVLTTIEKETEEAEAQEVVFSKNCKHRNGIVILKTAKSEFEMLESLKVKHKQMAEKRQVVKSIVRGVDDASVEKELAHWFTQKKHLTFHAEKFGLTHRKIVLQSFGDAPIDKISLPS
ncbi:UNVERIFIED_CONTAM: hypothetical protein HDU68_012228 [Siphonaria sp. JEL0065]|nr:hypothetical protein HDU68_012228 [Siphonaria sp. JEL0065]